MTTTTIEPLVAARGISKSYGHVAALRDVSIELPEGETTALVGDNGAGKSTLIKILCGVIQPDEGTITVNGEHASFGSPRDSRAAGITAVYQDLALADNLSVADNVFLGRTPTRGPRVDRRRMAREAAEVLSELGINVPSVKARVEKLSGGQRQSVAIARAVHEGGRLMILDEPTAALGVQEATKVLKIIQDLRHRGIATLVVSHNLEHVFHLADRIVVLRGGRLVGSRRKSETTHSEIVHMIVGGDMGRALGESE
jgi:simple sugar transport system ATP-binding protein